MGEPTGERQPWGPKGVQKADAAAALPIYPYQCVNVASVCLAADLSMPGCPST